jgi:serine/threonine protein kinase
MKEQMQWVAYIRADGECHISQVSEMRGLPEDHYDYEEPVFLPLKSIKVITENSKDETWRETLRHHLKSNHPELLNYQLLKVPRDPWDERKLVDDPLTILKANLDVKAGGTPEVGNIVDGTFQIEKYLGGGAAGKAFEVTLVRDWAGHPRGKNFCLKWYRDEIFDREKIENVIARRVREATLGGSLKHPNLVRTYDTSEFWVGEIPRYLLMDLIPGETLEELAKRGPLASDSVRQFLLDAASGLKALHDRGILHRDVKAANVMVSADRRAILLDLGVVRAMTDITMTGSQAFLGTLRFAAPEWLTAEECTVASDVYSLGTIAYHLITGHEIFSADRLYSRLVIAVSTKDPPLSQDNWDSRRRYLGKLTRRMLAKRPSERPTLGEVIEVLENDQKFRVWSGLEESGIFRNLPTPYQADTQSQRALVEAVLDSIPESELRKIVEQRDCKSLMHHKAIRCLFNFMDFDEAVEDYLELPPEHRYQWAKEVLAGIERDESLDLGVQIEQRCALMETLYEAERSDEVRKQLHPLLEETSKDMSDMMRDLAQENP